MLDPETRLFQAVVAQAFADAVAPITQKEIKRRAKEPEAKFYARIKAAKNEAFNQEIERGQARRWLTMNGKSFRVICECAALNPDWVLGKAMKLKAEGWPQRVARGVYAEAA